MRWQRTLKPITKEPDQFKFAVYDVEAADWINHIATGFFDGETYIEFYDHAEFIDYLFTQTSVENIFAHFGGGYDFNFTMDASFDVPHIKLKEDGFIERGSKLLKMVLIDERNDREIRFWDSSAILQFSLAKITKTFDVETKKGSFDFEKLKGKKSIFNLSERVAEELLDYLCDDCLALHQSLTKFYAQDIFKQSGPAFTIAGQAQKVFRTYLVKEMRDCPNQVDRIVRLGYFGGRTEIFRPLAQDTKLNAYDVNSLYPYICMTEDMPGDFIKATERFVEDSMGWWYCDVFCPEMYLPFLGTTQKSKLLFPTGSFSGVYSTNEINYARSLGYDIKVLHGVLFENAGRIFEQYMKDLYEIKKAHKPSDVMYVIAKLLMNSLYGKFGTNRENKNDFLIDVGQKDVKFHSEIFIGDKQVRFATKQKYLNTHSHVGIAAQVTAQSRIHMHKLMRPIQHAIYYTDTDSIYTTEKLPTGDDLGQLKLEGTSCDACFLLPKTYIIDGKVKMKGFESKKIQHFTLQDFTLALTGELHHLRIEIPEKFMKYKSALRSGKILNMHKASSKEIRSLYDKREIFRDERGEFNTRPHKLNGG